LAQEEQFWMYRSRELQDTGEQWAAKAQMWFFDTFKTIWIIRNDAEYGLDRDQQWLIWLQ
jgi:hypothetical protein